MASAAANHPPADHAVALRTGWRLQSSCRVSASGEQISTVGFDAGGWHRTEVPTTVAAALVADKTYPDPYVGMNFRSLPGVSYPIGDLFPEIAMPTDSPFRCSWWFRAEFQNPRDASRATRWLRFDGINYRANIWVNGHKIADAKDIAGTFRAFEFNVTDSLRDGPNAVAVEVFAPEVTDLAINWWDWNPTPPDKNMGLWNEVWLVSSGPAALRHPFASAKLSPSLDSAALTLEVEVQNGTAQPLNGDLTAKVGGITVSRRVDLQASEKKLVTFTADEFPSLRIAHPRLWWPYSMGEQNLYTAEFRFQTAAQVSDSAHTRFGIREFTSELTPQQGRLFRINGRKLYVVGGGWASDMLRLRESPQYLRDEFRYVRHMRLNTIRLEGKLEDDDFYELADEQGILLMPGWMCCDIWQKWDKWPPENLPIARESERTQLLRLRNHPSVMVWFYGSDEPPPPAVEKEYVQVVEETHWPNPILATASDRTTPLGGRSGVKMSGPYDYVPPSYWYEPGATNIEYGGGFAFNTETSAGAAIPPRASLEKMLTAAHLWPIDEAWSLHSAGQEFSKLDRLTAQMAAIYGPAADLNDFLRKAHAMEFDSQRAMFEVYRRNRYSSTGIIQWMLNNAWPSLYWHLYDWYLVPAAGYFSARTANEPLHIQYSYDDRSVAVINDLTAARTGLSAIADLYDLDLHRRFTRKVPVNLPANGVQRILSLPEVPDSPVSFLRLRLEDGRGRTVSSNFYWLSAKQSTFDWKKSTFYNTPSPQYEDFTALARLPEAQVDWSVRVEKSAAGPKVRVQVRNTGETLAFQAWLRAYLKSDGSDVVPVMWDDNYISLLPGESKSVVASFAPGQSLDDVAVELGGWNLAAESKVVARSGGTH